MVVCYLYLYDLKIIPAKVLSIVINSIGRLDFNNQGSPVSIKLKISIHQINDKLKHLHQLMFQFRES